MFCLGGELTARESRLHYLAVRFCIITQNCASNRTPQALPTTYLKYVD